METGRFSERDGRFPPRARAAGSTGMTDDDVAAVIEAVTRVARANRQ